MLTRRLSLKSKTDDVLYSGYCLCSLVHIVALDFTNDLILLFILFKCKYGRGFTNSMFFLISVLFTLLLKVICSLVEKYSCVFPQNWRVCYGVLGLQKIIISARITYVLGGWLLHTEDCGFYDFVFMIFLRVNVATRAEVVFFMHRIPTLSLVIKSLAVSVRKLLVIALLVFRHLVPLSRNVFHNLLCSPVFMWFFQDFSLLNKRQIIIICPKQLSFFSENQILTCWL